MSVVDKDMTSFCRPYEPEILVYPPFQSHEKSLEFFCTDIHVSTNHYSVHEFDRYFLTISKIAADVHYKFPLFKQESQTENNESNELFKERNKYHTIRMFGRTKEGWSVAVHVHGYPVYCYVQLPDTENCVVFANALDEWISSTIIACNMGATTHYFGYRLVYKRRLYGFENFKKWPFVQLYFGCKSSRLNMLTLLAGHNPWNVDGCWNGFLDGLEQEIVKDSVSVSDHCLLISEDHVPLDLVFIHDVGFEEFSRGKLRFKTSSWVRLNASAYSLCSIPPCQEVGEHECIQQRQQPFGSGRRKTHCTLEAYCIFDNVMPFECSSVPPLIVYSWDTETMDGLNSGKVPDPRIPENNLICFSSAILKYTPATATKYDELVPADTFCHMYKDCDPVPSRLEPILTESQRVLDPSHIWHDEHQKNLTRHRMLCHLKNVFDHFSATTSSDTTTSKRTLELNTESVAILRKIVQDTTPRIVCYSSEYELLYEWQRWLTHEICPDIMTGYNWSGYDTDFVDERLKIFNIPCRLSKMIFYPCPISVLGGGISPHFSKSNRSDDGAAKEQTDLESYYSKVLTTQHNEHPPNSKNFFTEKESIEKKNESFGGFAREAKTWRLPGVIQIDVMRILMKSDRLRSYRLKFVSSLYLNDTKEDLLPHEIWSCWRGTAKDRTKIVTYAVQDALLPLRLLLKFNMVGSSLVMSQAKYVTWNTIATRGQQIGVLSQIIRTAHSEGILITPAPKNHPFLPTSWTVEYNRQDKEEKFGKGYVFDECSQQNVVDLRWSHGAKPRVSKEHKTLMERDDLFAVEFQGAFVLPPLTGAYGVGDVSIETKPHRNNDPTLPSWARQQPVLVLDYMSLYPTSEIAYGLCYTNLVLDERYANVDGVQFREDYVIGQDGKSIVGKYKWAINTVGTVVPNLLQNLLNARGEAKKKMRDEKDSFQKSLLDGMQLALKISANSVYGFTGVLKNALLPCLPIAICTTFHGRNTLMMTQRIVEKNYGGHVIYGDTDSVFVVLPERSDLRVCNDEEVFEAISIQSDALQFLFDSCHYEYQWITNTLKTSSVVELVRESDHVRFRNMCLSARREKRRLYIFEIAKKIAADCSAQLPKPMLLQVEKLFDPFLIFARKRYAGMMYPYDTTVKSDIKESGLPTVRRDSVDLLQSLLKKALRALLRDRSLNLAVRLVQQTLLRMVKNEIPLKKLQLSNSVSVKDYDVKPAHMVIAEKKMERGETVSIGDRVSYVFIQPPRTTKQDRKKMKVAERVEDTDYVLKHGLRIDYDKYLERFTQPLEQLFSALISDTNDLFREARLALEYGGKPPPDIRSFWQKNG